MMSNDVCALVSARSSSGRATRILMVKVQKYFVVASQALCRVRMCSKVVGDG
jgi:hypothetical protein